MKPSETLRWLLANVPEDTIEEHGQDITEAANEATQLEVENEALREYATHKPGCHENGDKCVCGLDALLIGEDEGFFCQKCGTVYGEIMACRTCQPEAYAKLTEGPSDTPVSDIPASP